MAKSPIAADVSQAPNGSCNLPTQGTLNHVLTLKVSSKDLDLLLIEVACRHTWVEAQALTDFCSGGSAHPINISQRYIQSLSRWDVDTNNAWHMRFLLGKGLLALTLLVGGIRFANHANNASAFHDLAMDTHTAD
jgi:hypothetical protein